LDKLIFVNKNWPNALRIDCKSPNVVDLIETNAYLEEFEKTFERYEVMKFLDFGLKKL
jgi:hypothetical protein